MRGRIRTIKPEALTDEDLWDLEDETGLPIFRAFAGLWMYADREGRFEWRPRPLKAAILPYWQGEFSRVLDALATRGFVRRYEVEGREYGLVVNFTRHQSINNKEPQSSLPAPPDLDPGAPDSPTDPNGSTRARRVRDACETPESRDAGVTLDVTRGMGMGMGTDLPPTPLATPPPPEPGALRLGGGGELAPPTLAPEAIAKRQRAARARRAWSDALVAIGEPPEDRETMTPSFERVAALAAELPADADRVATLHQWAQDFLAFADSRKPSSWCSWLARQKREGKLRWVESAEARRSDDRKRLQEARALDARHERARAEAVLPPPDLLATIRRTA